MLQSGQPLKVWDSIEIIVGEVPDTGKYSSRIEDFINGGIVITSPEFIEGHTLLRHNVDVTVNVVREDAVYQFHSQIRQRSSSHGRYLILTPPRNVRRVQRRRFVRIEMLALVEYAWIKPTMEWEDYEERLEWKTTTSTDISGGGILMKLADDEGSVEKDALMLLRPEYFKELDLPEEVVGVCRRIFSDENSVFAGVEILTTDYLRDFFSVDQIKRLPGRTAEFDSQAQDKLVSWVFNQQIALRNKGLL